MGFDYAGSKKTVAQHLAEYGVEVCCVSLGELGAALVTKEYSYLAPALNVEVKGIQGAGDSLVAGMTIAMMEKCSDREILQYAMAPAGGSVMREGTMMCTKENFDLLFDKVEIIEVQINKNK